MCYRVGWICVLREVHGKTETLALAGQRDFREWIGCFTAIEWI